MVQYCVDQAGHYCGALSHGRTVLPLWVSRCTADLPAEYHPAWVCQRSTTCCSRLCAGCVPACQVRQGYAEVYTCKGRVGAGGMHVCQRCTHLLRRQGRDVFILRRVCWEWGGILSGPIGERHKGSQGEQQGKGAGVVLPRRPCACGRARRHCEGRVSSCAKGCLAENRAGLAES